MKNIMSNWIGLAGSYGISFADLTGIVQGLPDWVGIISAMAGALLTAGLAAVRFAEARIKMADARKKELELKKHEQ